MKPEELILINALALIRDPSKWTSGTWARGEDNYSTSLFSENAKCWCSEGAILRAAGKVWETVEELKEINKAFEALIDAMPAAFKKECFDKSKVPTVALFNDTQDHAAVVSVFETAIWRLGKDDKQG